MAFFTFLPENPEPKMQPSKRKRKQKQKQKQQKQSSSSWDQIKNLLTCRQIEGSSVHDPSKHPNGLSKIGSSACISICSFRDVVHGNIKVVHRADNSPEGSAVGQDTGLLISRKPPTTSSSTRSLSGCGRSNGRPSYTPSSRGRQFRKLSGCYECHTIIDPSSYPCPRATVSVCPRCGEVFPKIESLELHQKVRHAVSELGPEDSGRNIVEIIFRSSWLKKDSSGFMIERIMKVHNTPRTIQRFEDCRDAVKTRAPNSTRKNPRCAADGNELLRFHCTTIACSLGARGSSILCGSVPACGVCTIIRHGFQVKESKGVGTTASSGRAHDSLLGCTDGRRAMLVCRVIAGRVLKRVTEDALPGEEDGVSAAAASGTYDSVAGHAGIYSNLEELFVFNPMAILPCFVVIYRGLEW